MADPRLKKVNLTFTDFLYGVVAGSSFQRIERLELNQSNVLLIISLLILFDDFILYRTDSCNIDYSPKKQLLLYWFDLGVLAAWYAASLASKEPVFLFFLLASVFYVLASLWEVVFTEDRQIHKLLVDTDLPLAFLLLVIGLLLYFGLGFITGIIMFSIAFSACRFNDYRVLLRG